MKKTELIVLDKETAISCSSCRTVLLFEDSDTKVGHSTGLFDFYYVYIICPVCESEIGVSSE